MSLFDFFRKNKKAAPVTEAPSCSSSVLSQLHSVPVNSEQDAECAVPDNVIWLIDRFSMPESLRSAAWNMAGLTFAKIIEALREEYEWSDDMLKKKYIPLFRKS